MWSPETGTVIDLYAETGLDYIKSRDIRLGRDGDLVSLTWSGVLY
jgi:hypothetical protein